LLLTVFTQRNFVADFLQQPFCAYESPLWGLMGNIWCSS